MSDQTYPGPKVIVMGGPGAGKTFSLHTLVRAGKEVFILATDNGVEVLGQFKAKVPGWTDEDQKKIHFRYFPPAHSSWDALKATGQLLNTFSNDALQTMEDRNKGKYTQLLDLIDCCANFKDQHGVEWGNVAEWGNDRVLVLDNTTGINLMARGLGCGGKPIITQPNWGKIMDYEERIINMLASVNCPVVIIAHIDREINEVTQGMLITLGLLGRKLAPKIPRLFSDVVLAWRDGATFYWSTAKPDSDVKARNLPIGDKLAPSFVPLFTNWEAGEKLLTAEQNVT